MALVEAIAAGASRSETGSSWSPSAPATPPGPRWSSGRPIRLEPSSHQGADAYGQPQQAPGGGRRSDVRPDRQDRPRTGGSRGLGRAIALALAGQGRRRRDQLPRQCRGRRESWPRSLALGRRALSIQGDTSAGREACEAIVKTALDGLGSIDILVNNAGITRDNLLCGWTPRSGMPSSTRTWAAVRDARAIARPMMKAPRANHHMSSAAGRMGNPGQANYAAAKAWRHRA